MGVLKKAYLKDEEKINKNARRCPKCNAPTSHYRGHACHHIKPGSGCSQCREHWCYQCVKWRPAHASACAFRHDIYCYTLPKDGKAWNPMDCGCAPCPDCKY